MNFSPELVKTNMLASELLTQGLIKLKELKQGFIAEVEAQAYMQIQAIENQDISKSANEEGLNRQQRKQKLKNLEGGRAEAIKQTRNWRNKTIAQWDKGISEVLFGVESINAFLANNRTEDMDFGIAKQAINENSELIQDSISSVYDAIVKQREQSQEEE